MVIFLAKRQLIAFVTVFLDILPVAQIATGIYVTLASMSFTYNVWPMEYWYLNWIELANDLLFITTNYFAFMFTDFIANVSTRYGVGDFYFWYLIDYMSAIFLFILFTVVLTLREFYKSCVIKKKMQERKQKLIEEAAELKAKE